MNYKEIAKEIRRTVLSMIHKAQVSHIGSNFSAIDIFTVLYSKADFKKDKLVVSKGWIAASIYAFGVKYGLCPQEAVDTFCDGKSKYIGLIEPLGFFGAEIAGGSMGLGLPGAVGLALGKKLKGEEGRVYVLMSDGELQCGTTWESALIAAHHKLNNLMVIVDYNGLQAMGRIEDILNLTNYEAGRYVFDLEEKEYDLQKKFESFGWHVCKVPGHDYKLLEDRLKFMPTDGPKLVIANTIKGKGVSFMENQNLYHYKQLSDEEYKKAIEELK